MHRITIVVVHNLLIYRVMKQNIIFKASGNGHIYKVIESPKRGLYDEVLFRVIDGRKWTCGADFYNLSAAICTACNLAAPIDVRLQIVK